MDIELEFPIIVQMNLERRLFRPLVSAGVYVDEQTAKFDFVWCQG